MTASVEPSHYIRERVILSKGLLTFHSPERRRTCPARRPFSPHQLNNKLRNIHRRQRLKFQWKLYIVYLRTLPAWTLKLEIIFSRGWLGHRHRLRNFCLWLRRRSSGSEAEEDFPDRNEVASGRCPSFLVAGWVQEAQSCPEEVERRRERLEPKRMAPGRRKPHDGR